MKNLMGLLALATLAACAGGERRPDLSSQIRRANGPEWVNRGSGAYAGQQGKVFYGVGIASGIRSAALRRSSADSRARAEIARQLESYVTFLHKEYQASKAGPAGEEERVQQALKTYSQTELSGVTIVDHWIDTDGTEYSLAQLEMAAFKGGLHRMKELSSRVREVVRANADKAFDELSEEEARQNAQ